MEAARGSIGPGAGAWPRHDVEAAMGDGVGGVPRLVQRTLQTCVRGLVLAVVPAGVCIPLFIFSVFSVILLASGIGIVPAPTSLLAVRRLASRQRRAALQWSGVTIVTPYRPRPIEVTNGLIGRLQRCKWLLTDPATWRGLLGAGTSRPAGLAPGALPAALIGPGLVGLLSGGWLHPGHLRQLPLFAALIVLGV